MSVEEPPYLVVGTDVSAKYRGAFCEAKVKKIVKLVKVKVTLKESGTSLMVTDEDVNGLLKVGMRVEVKNPDSGTMSDAVVNKIMDSSTYTVVFDDGDENTLRRTQLCLKGDRHFVKSETLDQLPLTHPEHFGTPVMKSGKGYKRRRPGGGGASESESEVESSDEGSPKKVYYKGRLQELVGRVVLMEFEDRKKTSWVPVLVVSAGASDLPLPSKDHLLVKSFKDNKFYTVNKKDTKEFAREAAVKNEDKTLKISNERAVTYLDSRDLPPNWDKEELLGNESDEEEQSDSSDDEPSEEKDRFVAQLYKFMDDRGTPINKAPVISNHDLDLYRLFRVVQNLGGYNKVTNQMKWKAVYSKMNLPPLPTSASQIKTAYKKYCGAFEDFYRKLGSTMGTISRPGRSRHSSGRSLLSFREREKDSPRSPKSEKKSKEDKKDDKKEDEKAKSTKDADKTKAKDSEKTTGKKEEPIDEQEDQELESPRKSRSRTQEQKRTPMKEDTTKEKEPDVSKPITREDIYRQTREEAKSSQGKIKQDELWKPNKPETRNTTKEEEKKNAKEEKKVEEKNLKDEDKKGSKELERRGGKEEEKKMVKEIEKRGGKEEKVVKDDKKAEKSDITEDDKPRKKPKKKKVPTATLR